MMTSIMFPAVIVGGIGLICAIVLVVAAKVMALPADELFDSIRAELPGANCGACGYAGCDDYAKAVAHDGAKTNLCVPGGAGVAAKVSAAMGVAAESVEAKYAVVRCSGNCYATDSVMDYKGKQSCAACNFFYQGKGSCSHGCLGYGDCINACQYGAISIVDGIAVIDKAACVGCGMCAKACPNQLITVIPASSTVYVGCSSHDKGAYTRKVCKNGCIGCKKCERTCEHGAITVTDNLASIDPEKCVNCGNCVTACPTGAIVTCESRCEAIVKGA